MIWLRYMETGMRIFASPAVVLFLHIVVSFRPFFVCDKGRGLIHLWKGNKPAAGWVRVRTIGETNYYFSPVRCGEATNVSSSSQTHHFFIITSCSCLKAIYAPLGPSSTKLVEKGSKYESLC